MNTATLIRETREAADLTQAELAERAGTSQPAVSRYEAGAASPSVATLDRLLAVMGASLDLGVHKSTRSLDVRTPRMAKIRGHRQAILRAARKHHATNVAVFGSVVRGQDGPDSDVDFLVDLDVYTLGLLPLNDLRLDLEEILGERVDVAARAILAEHVAQNALAEAVAL